MKPENQWSEKAKAPDPDDLTSEQPVTEGRPHVDYTAMAHHDEIPDSADTGDISRPQGPFWHGNERPGAEALRDEPRGPEEPMPPTPETREGTAELPPVFTHERGRRNRVS
jgi:hypothetical protein